MDARASLDNIFEVIVEREMNAPAQVVFDAITLHTSGWLWPTDFAALRASNSPESETGIITEWDPPHRFANRVEGAAGFFNVLDHTIEDRGHDRSWLRYVHQGVNFDPERNIDDAVQQHTEFYLHTLDQYAQHFSPIDAKYADIQGPEASSAPDSFERVRSALGVNDLSVDVAVPVSIDGIQPTTAIVDFVTPNFIGLRAETALYRFFGRNAFGGVVGMTIHLFAPDADVVAEGAAWKKWLDGLYA
jgi:hypothetical protein